LQRIYLSRIKRGLIYTVKSVTMLINRQLHFLFKKFFRYYSNHFLPSWYVLLFDLAVIFTTYFVAYAISLNFNFHQVDFYKVFYQSVFITFAYGIFIWSFKSFSGIIRHTSLDDFYKIFSATSIGFISILTIAVVSRFSGFSFLGNIPLTVLFIHFLVGYFLLIGTRVIVKTMFHRLINPSRKHRINVVIYGAGESGRFARNALLKDENVQYNIIAFIDDNPEKNNKILEGVPILSPGAVLNSHFINKNKIAQLILAIQELELKQKKSIIETAIDYQLRVKVVPPIDNWINGQLSSGQIRKAQIEELLQRDTIKMDNSHVAKSLYGKVVMITGAAGSIGSGIVKQVLAYRPAKLILLDQSETAVYELQHEIESSQELKPLTHLTKCIIANIKDRFRLEKVFNKYRPEIIYHAAAYKHVPLMEQNPHEALLVNVFGTKSLADLALNYEVEKFVMVSTDKAVNPTNVMGASKRIAEIYTQSMSNGKTQFITTRFGNVLDSNGSVVPLFRKQIEHGGPITITHREITRYFMTISEACNLVLEAGVMGKGGEIFVFDMGEPVKIYDLAKKIIQLSGLEIDKDIKIKEIGLRPGEKLYEELLNDKENTLQTYHPKIMLAQVRKYNRDFVEKQLDKLADLVLDEDVFKLVAQMKEIVPEYLSNNSIFKQLDKIKKQE